jgi:hypothetical protein
MSTNWPRKVTVVGVAAGFFAAAVPYDAVVGDACNPAAQLNCWQRWEWADLPHTDPPHHSIPPSEADLTRPITSTARTFGPSAALSGSSGALKITLS